MNQNINDHLIKPDCWVLTDGKSGTENQCLGLAERLDLPLSIKRIRLRRPWKWLAPRWLRLGGLACLDKRADLLTPPWPGLLVASGRAAILPALQIKRLAGDACCAVVIQDPRIDPGNFDLVIVPKHDRLRDRNVLVTQGALHRVTKARLETESAGFADRFEQLVKPRWAILIGGDSRQHRLPTNQAKHLALLIRREAEAQGAAIMMTMSRRTPPESAAVFREILADLPGEIWDGEGRNPYFAYLHHADAILVSEDSVSMTSEAISTGKPVAILPLIGGSGKFRQFHQGLRHAGLTADFPAFPIAGENKTLDETGRAANVVRAMPGPLKPPGI